MKCLSKIYLVTLTLLIFGNFVTLAQEKTSISPKEVLPSQTSQTPKEKSALEEFKKKFKAGEEFSWVMLALSIFGVACVIERVVNQKRKFIAPLDISDKVLELMKQEKFTEADDLCKKSNSILGNVISSLIKHRMFSLSESSSLAGDVSARELKIHMQKAYPLLVIATVSPLLGLMGTVIGMIGAFESVAVAGNLGDPSIMAGEISLALITTAMGLLVAVPCIFAYHFFRRRLNLISTDLNEMANEVISGWYLYVHHQGDENIEHPTSNVQHRMEEKNIEQENVEKNPPGSRNLNPESSQ